MALELDKKLFRTSHDTVVTGWDKEGNVVFLKGYYYDRQKDEAQSDLSMIIDAGFAWRIGHVTLLKFEKELTEEDDE